MKIQSIDEMIKEGATPAEAKIAYDIFEILAPGLRVKRNGRIATAWGEKTPLGLYRVIRATIGQVMWNALQGKEG